MNNQKEVPVIQSLKTGIHIISRMVEQDRPLTFTDIQELTGITKSNLHKYLNTLTMTGLLYRDKKHGAYFLGSKLIEFGNAAIGSEDLIGRVNPYLKDIRNYTKLTTLLSIWTHDGPVIANIWSATYGLNIGAEIGTRLPLLSSAGKLFTAFKQSDEVIKWTQPLLDELSASEKEKFRREQAAIRETHFSYAAEPLVEYVSSFSVPILNYRQDILGAITVVGFTNLIPHSTQHPISSFVLESATEISGSFGGIQED